MPIDIAHAGGYGDYDTPEETFPDKPVPGNWQVIYHGSHFMSYDPDPSHYVNSSFIIWHLADVVAKGGLMQIGYGELTSMGLAPNFAPNTANPS